MNIAVYGLGIIGGSLAAAFTQAGHTVFGRDRDGRAVSYALEHGMIAAPFEEYGEAEAVFLALPPAAAMRELDEGEFPKGCIVCDVCGVKEAVEHVVCKRPRAYRYVGLHPMAGKEKSGIAVSDAGLFRGKNLVVTVRPDTDADALAAVEGLAREIGFGRIVRCSAGEHDRKIALTSQLAHIVSNAYIRSPAAGDVAGFTGGSFQDMTRVGGVDEELWTELYLANREALLSETEGLAERLLQYAAALREGDGERLRALLREGRLAHEAYFSEK